MSYSCWFGGHFDVVERGIERKSRLARFLLDQRANPLGQGVYNDATASLRLERSIVTENSASGGDGGAGGSDGEGIGGGVYNLGGFDFDALTLIFDNDASTSHDDVFDPFA
jgi:hypothetical protein